MNKDFLNNNVKASQSMDPVVITADANSASLDLKDYEGGAFMVNVGESGDTLSGSVKIELELEDSADDSTFADCANADIVDGAGAAGSNGSNAGSFALVDAAPEDDAMFIAHYTGVERYIRAVVNVTGTHTNGTPISIVGLRFGPRYRPAA